MSKTKRKLTTDQIRKEIEQPKSREGKRLDAPKISRARLKDELESQGD
jgi:hypothetical protein